MGKLKVVAENCSNAPAYFSLCIYAGAPEKDSRIITKLKWDPRDDPNFLFMIEIDQLTDPGKGVSFESEVNYEPKHSNGMPKLWFRTPPDMSRRFAVHEVSWNGQKLLHKKGWI